MLRCDDGPSYQRDHPDKGTTKNKEMTVGKETAKKNEKVPCGRCVFAKNSENETVGRYVETSQKIKTRPKNVFRRILSGASCSQVKTDQTRLNLFSLIPKTDEATVIWK